MNLWQAFKMAFKSISCKKTRSFLTMLGIIIGVASVVIMVSVVQGQNKKSMEYFEKMGDNKINVSASSYYDMNNETSQKLYDFCLSMNNLVAGITPDIEIGDKATVQYGAKTIAVNDWDNMGRGGSVDWQSMMHIKLGSDQYGACNNYTLAGGREMSYLDVEKTNAVCVLGYGAKEALFDYTDPVGETITINGQPFLVIGWYESMDIEYWPEMDNVIVLPYTFNRSMNKNSSINSYVVKAKSASATVEAMTRLDAFLAGLFPKNDQGNSDAGDYYVQSNNSSAEDIQNQSNMQALVLGAIAGISLLVGGIGIMNIMLVTVTERTREIGIRKAIGAERKSIIAQFLIEAAVICSIGGVIGIGIGCVGTLIAGKLLLDEIMMLPSTFITVGAFLFSVVLGVIFGMYPAIKASGLQPVVALRAD
ncbi:MAG: ABC transporter permease [Lawsonibacter sp.]|nr:ABC transporter permease [Lawsonibacter sp.]